jgi:hypothetical protein
VDTALVLERAERVDAGDEQKPPIPVSLLLKTSAFQPLRSMKRVYMRRRSPANSADSSPPVPARISMIVFLSSLGSFGTINS